jgi:hypothetical protein
MSIIKKVLPRIIAVIIGLALLCTTGVNINFKALAAELKWNGMIYITDDMTNSTDTNGKIKNSIRLYAGQDEKGQDKFAGLDLKFFKSDSANQIDPKMYKNA